MTRYSDFKTTQARDENILDKETQLYATFADLPLTNVQTGMKAYVQSNNSLYFWTGTGWSKIALINTAPTVTFDQSSYSMDSVAGSPTILTLTASDPEEIPLTYSYSFIPSNIVDSAISYVEDSSTITLTTTALGGLYNFKVIGSVSDGIYVTSDSADINLTLSSVISITRSATSIYEGSSVTFTVNTVGYPNGSLIPYTITGINSADINGASLSGNVTINNNAGALTLTTTLDTAGVVEGLETITFNAGGLSQTCSIIDVVPGSATAVASSINEDGSNQIVYFGLSNYPNTIYYTTNTTSADIQNPNGTCTFRFQNTINGSPFYNWQANLGGVIADNLTEGNETVTVSFRKDSTSGQVLKTTTFVINDTSLTPMNPQFGYSNSWNLVSSGWGNGNTLGLHHTSTGAELLIPDSFSSSASIRSYAAGGTTSAYTNGWPNSGNVYYTTYSNGSGQLPRGMNVQDATGGLTAGAILFNGSNVYYSSSNNFSNMTQVTSPYNPMPIRGSGRMGSMGALPNLNFVWIYGQDPDNPFQRTSSVEFQFQPAAFGQYSTNTDGIGWNQPYNTLSPTPPSWGNGVHTTTTFDTVNSDVFLAASNSTWSNPTGIQRWHWTGSGPAYYTDSIPLPTNGPVSGLQIIGDYMFAMVYGNLYSLYRG